MPLFAKIIVALELAIAAYFIVAIVVKLIERIKEYKKDKYKNIKY